MERAGDPSIGITNLALGETGLLSGKAPGCPQGEEEEQALRSNVSRSVVMFYSCEAETGQGKGMRSCW